MKNAILLNTFAILTGVSINYSYFGIAVAAFIMAAYYSVKYFKPLIHNEKD